VAGTYSVTVTVGGCTSLVGTTAAVVVNAAPATPVPSINGSTTPAAICAGGTITLTTPNVAGATYSWTGPNTYAAAVRNPPALTAVTVAMGGTYSLTVTVGGCTSAAGTVSIVVNPIPATPTATNTGPYCVGATILLSTPTVGGSTYAWTGPSAFASVLQNPTRPGATIAMAGTYSVTLTTAGCTSLAGTTVVAVSASVTPGVTVVASPAGAICAGTSVTFTATPAGGGTTPSYQWQVNGSNVGVNSPIYTSTTLTNGQIVTCIMTSNSPCAAPLTATSTGITMTVNPTVVPSVSVVASPVGAICAGSSVTFTATPTNGGTTPTYQWQVNGVNAGAGGTTFTSTTLTNGQIVTCILTSNATCASPSTATSTGITMTVNPTLVPSVSIVASPVGSICAGSSVTFTATPTNGGTTPTYQWQVNGVNAGVGGTTFTSTTIANGDVVTCILTSNAACASPATATGAGTTMTVTPTVTPTIAISIASGTNPTCSGQPVTFFASITNGGTTPSYQWQINGSNAGTNLATFTSSTLNNGDIVTCILTSNATCASPASVTSTSIVMVVNPTPTTPTITQVGTTLTSSSATGNQWYLNGVLIVGATSQNYTFTANGTYTVVVTAGTCSSAISAPVVITTTGIDEAGNPYLLSIYPNPNDGNFNVSFNATEKGTYKVELTNALGQLIFKDELKDFTGTYTKQLSVVDYGKGIYTISLINSKNEAVKKIIVY
jgi:Secretion system C-terminal sorting domain